MVISAGVIAVTEPAWYTVNAVVEGVSENNVGLTVNCSTPNTPDADAPLFDAKGKPKIYNGLVNVPDIENEFTYAERITELPILV